MRISDWSSDVCSSDLIRPEDLAKQLDTADLPPLDLLIRTSGERRLSNFMVWQAAYAELYFTDTLWPDFNGETLAQALAEFGLRERRHRDRKSVVEGKSVSVRVDSVGGSIIKNKLYQQHPHRVTLNTHREQ